MANIATLLPTGKLQIVDSNGAPLVDGTITYKIPNTDTLKNTWVNAGKTVLNTNPVVLDSLGTATVYGDGQYRMTVTDVDGNILYDALTQSTNTATTYINVQTAFGAVGDGVADDTAALQAALDYTVSTGGCIYIPTGLYRVTSGLVATYVYTNVTAVTRPSIKGDGPGNSQILWDGANTPSVPIMKLQRLDSSDNNGLHANSVIEGISFGVLSAGKVGYASGLRLLKWSWIHVSDVFVSNLNVGIELNQVISSQFDNLKCYFNKYGLFSIGAPTSAATPVYANNANVFNACTVGNNTLGGFLSEDGSFDWNGGSIEINGTAGTSGSGYGAFINNTAVGSPIACNFNGVYFEGNGTTGDPGTNATTADVWIVHNITVDNLAYNFSECNFNRLAANYAPYGVFINKTTTTVANLSVGGSVFTNYSGYTASSNRKYIKISDSSGSPISVGVDAPNNFYNQPTELPDFITGSVFYGGSSPTYSHVKSFCASVYPSGTQSIPTGTATALSFDTASINDASIWASGSPTRLTVPAGVSKVRLAGNVRYASDGTANVNWQLFLRKNGAGFNGAPYQQLFNPTGATANHTLNCSSGVIIVNPGDYFELFTQQNTGSSISTANDILATWFSLEVIE